MGERIHLSDTPAVTYPITVAAATDSLLFIDFDGFLNDDRVSVVYSLAEPAQTLKSVEEFKNNESRGTVASALEVKRKDNVFTSCRRRVRCRGR